MSLRVEGIRDRDGRLTSSAGWNAQISRTFESVPELDRFTRTCVPSCNPGIALFESHGAISQSTSTFDTLDRVAITGDRGTTSETFVCRFLTGPLDLVVQHFQMIIRVQY